jgi:hypothetical protein
MSGKFDDKKLYVLAPANVLELGKEKKEENSFVFASLKLLLDRKCNLSSSLFTFQVHVSLSN